MNDVANRFSPWISDGDEIDFAPGTTLPPHFTNWRFPHADSYVISPPNHPYTVQINPSVANLTFTDGKSAPPEGVSFLGRRQQDTLFTYSVNMDYSPTAINEEAGVTVFLQENAHLEMGVVLLEANTPYLRVKGASTVAVPKYQTPLPSAWMNQTLHLEIKAVNWTHYSFSAGPLSSMSQINTLAYAANSAVSAGFTGKLTSVKYHNQKCPMA
jgi:beta-xylosidase